MWPNLTEGDRGPEVRQLQCLLNRPLGLVALDGFFGPATALAVTEARALAGLAAGRACNAKLALWLTQQPHPFPPLSIAGINLLVAFEVGRRHDYETRYRFPVCPSAESGVTIGVGYDLRFASQASLRADWAALPEATLAALAPHCGKSGSAAAVAALKRRRVSIPWSLAWAVFCQKTLPGAYAKTRAVFAPAFDALPPHRRAVLVSLVYNRGADCDPAKPRRREMAAIRAHLKAGRPDLVSEELRAMKRLWDGVPEPPATGEERVTGLLNRRDEEARIWDQGFVFDCL